ncbi:MAG: AsmA-like C-terminal domain-containing protein, partial [Desulfobulbaceae bacterium]|nr:AsmA-like C-terminal domain-containing protein [Desulfobulbaceae bacterium]
VTLPAIAYLAPKILHVDAITATIAQRLQQEIPGEVTMGDVQWRWLPFPHVSVHKLRIDNEHLQADLPIAALYPDWLAILTGQPARLRSITLKDPRIILKKIERSNTVPQLPSLSLKIKNGSLTTPRVDAGGIPTIPALSMSAVNGILKMTPSTLAGRLSGSAPFVKKVTLKGNLDLHTWRYKAEIDCQKLILRKGSTIRTDAIGDLAIADSVLNLKSRVSGEGATRFKLDLIGDLPCLLLHAQEKELPINCGFADLTIEKDGPALSLAIRELEIREPSITLQGSLRRTPVADAADQWHVDLTAKKLDLAAIRAGVLAVLPQDEVAVMVCDIVRSGNADSASFRFNGPLTDLAHLRKMTIAADVKAAAIHIPDVNLDIFDATGPILIENGALTGRGLSAKLGKSVGRNGTLLVGLAEDHFGFELDLDLDADLADIAMVLKQQVPHQPFQEELARFSNPKGTASGHLFLGDHQHHVDVAVAVKKMHGSFDYNRSPWPITVHDGTLAVDTKVGMVNWQDLSAAIGEQRINRSSGTVHWGESPVRLTINDLEANLAAGPLYKSLDAYPALAGHVRPLLTAVHGTLALQKGTTLSGPLFDPAHWQYRLPMTAENLRWRSSLLPEEVTTRKASAVLTDNGLTVTESENAIGANPISISGELQHQRLQHWSGVVNLAGSIGEESGAWIKKKGWLPPSLMPRIPAHIDNMRLAWDDENLHLTGAMHAPGIGLSQPSLTFDMHSRADNPLQMKLDFAKGDEKGQFSLDLLDKKPETFSLQWRGTVRGATIRALMADKNLLNGDLQGDIRMTVPAPSTNSRFDGWLRADKFRWYWGYKTEYIKVGTLRLQGKKDKLLVKKLDLDFGGGETLTAHGAVTPDVDGLMVDFGLTSPLLSQQTINDFLDDLDAVERMQIDACDGGKPDWSLLGTIDFKVDEFQSFGTKKATGPGKNILHWRPLAGRVELYPAKETKVLIDTADLCCLNVSGVWSSTRHRKDASFKVATKCTPHPLFQNVLTCLGLKQDLIEGAFTVSGEIHGSPKKWQSGGLSIHSDQGRILRMTLLSRIFSVVNLTDLFAKEGLPSLEKEGFPYSNLDFEAEIKDNQLIINKGVVKGKGLNLFARGKMDLANYEADFTVLIAPFKTLDAIVSNIPLLGRVIGGKNATLLTIPVKVTGPITNPNVVPLAPSAIGEGLINIVKDAVLLPFTILDPILTDKKKEGGATPPAPPRENR